MQMGGYRPTKKKLDDEVERPGVTTPGRIGPIRKGQPQSAPRNENMRKMPTGNWGKAKPQFSNAVKPLKRGNWGNAWGTSKSNSSYAAKTQKRGNWRPKYTPPSLTGSKSGSKISEEEREAILRRLRKKRPTKED